MIPSKVILTRKINNDPFNDNSRARCGKRHDIVAQEMVDSLMAEDFLSGIP